MTIKTYGVFGLMEWSALIGNDNVRLRIDFTGGSVTGYGVSPAEYTTSNPVIQTLIEDSPYFRSGRIRIIRQSDPVSAAVDRNSSSGSSFPSGNSPVVSCSINEAVDFLKKMGVPPADLIGRSNIERIAAGFNLTID